MPVSSFHFGPGEVERVERLQPRLPGDGDLAAGILLGGVDRGLRRRRRPRPAAADRTAAQPPSAVPAITNSRLRIFIACLPDWRAPRGAHAQPSNRLSSAASLPRQAALIHHFSVDDAGGYPALHHLQHRAHVGRPVAGEALVGPAQRMGCHDDVVELEDRLVGRARLDLEHVEPGAGDRAVGESAVERALVDHRPARGVDDVGRGLHQAAAAARPRCGASPRSAAR